MITATTKATPATRTTTMATAVTRAETITTARTLSAKKKKFSDCSSETKKQRFTVELTNRDEILTKGRKLIKQEKRILTVPS